MFINLDEELKLLEEMSKIEKFMVEHLFIDMEDDGVDQGVATIVETNHQDQRKLEDARFSMGNIDRDIHQ
jgi:hypothetical protein